MMHHFTVENAILPTSSNNATMHVNARLHNNVASPVHDAYATRPFNDCTFMKYSIT